MEHASDASEFNANPDEQSTSHWNQLYVPTRGRRNRVPSTHEPVWFGKRISWVIGDDGVKIYMHVSELPAFLKRGIRIKVEAQGSVLFVDFTIAQDCPSKKIRFPRLAVLELST